MYGSPYWKNGGIYVGKFNETKEWTSMSAMIEWKKFKERGKYMTKIKTNISEERES